MQQLSSSTCLPRPSIMATSVSPKWSLVSRVMVAEGAKRPISYNTMMIRISAESLPLDYATRYFPEAKFYRPLETISNLQTYFSKPSIAFSLFIFYRSTTRNLLAPWVRISSRNYSNSSWQLVFPFFRHNSKTYSSCLWHMCLNKFSWHSARFACLFPPLPKIFFAHRPHLMATLSECISNLIYFNLRALYIFCSLMFISSLVEMSAQSLSSSLHFRSISLSVLEKTDSFCQTLQVRRRI